MSHSCYLDNEKENFILANAGKKTIKQIAGHIGLPYHTVYEFGRNMGVSFKVDKVVRNCIPGPVKVSENEVPFERAPAIYNNLPSPYGVADELRGLRLA